MKRAIRRFLLSREFQNSIFAGAIRTVVRKTAKMNWYSLNFLTDFGAIERPHYAWCMLRSVDLAKRLGYSKISGIEFGVAGGNGLVFMRRFADALQEKTGIAIECYGFDTGSGMPEPEGPRDLPYWFRQSQYAMEVKRLEERLGNVHLVIGDIRDTVSRFVEEYNPAPIGFIFNDTDYYSSTFASLQLFNHAISNPDNFMPRIFQYYDDIIGSAWEMYGTSNGQLAAVEDFNNIQQHTKIHLNQNLLRDTHRPWRYQIYYCHLFGHPRYETFVGGAEQDRIQEALTLR